MEWVTLGPNRPLITRLLFVASFTITELSSSVKFRDLTLFVFPLGVFPLGIFPLCWSEEILRFLDLMKIEDEALPDCSSWGNACWGKGALYGLSPRSEMKV